MRLSGARRVRIIKRSGETVTQQRLAPEATESTLLCCRKEPAFRQLAATSISTTHGITT